MKSKKPLAVRIFIRICVVFMVISLIGVYVVYMFVPQKGSVEISDETVDTGINGVIFEENMDGDNENLVITDVD